LNRNYQQIARAGVPYYYYYYIFTKPDWQSTFLSAHCDQVARAVCIWNRNYIMIRYPTVNFVFFCSPFTIVPRLRQGSGWFAVINNTRLAQFCNTPGVPSLLIPSDEIKSKFTSTLYTYTGIMLPRWIPNCFTLQQWTGIPLIL